MEGRHGHLKGGKGIMENRQKEPWKVRAEVQGGKEAPDDLLIVNL